jgi:tetratricopeptide (TPR) repeat protein
MCSGWYRLAAILLLVSGTVIACRDSSTAARAYVARGDQFMADKKISQAILEYRNAVREDARFGEARSKLARAYDAGGDQASATREFVRAADLMPADNEAQLAAATALVAAGRFEDARTRADAVLKRDPKNVQAFVIRGNASAGLRDLDGALGDLKNAVGLAPQFSGPLMNVGLVYAMRGEQAEAEASFKQAIVVNPRSIPARMALANYYVVVGKPGSAEEVVRAALAIEPRNATANRALAYLALRTGRPAQAEAPLRLAAEVSTDLQDRLTLADYLVAQRRTPEAARVLEELRSHKEAFAAASVRLAGIEYEAGRADRAHQIVLEILQKEPNNAEVMTVRGNWLLREKKVDGAEAAATAAIKANPRLAAAQILLGAVLVARHDTTEALKAYNHAIDLNPRATDAHLALARLNLSLGRNELAAQFARQAVDAIPANGDAHLLLARALLAAGDLESARLEAQILQRGAGDAAAVQTFIGDLAYRTRDRQGARRAYERAVALDPGAVDALTGLVTLDVGAKKLDVAIARVDAQLAKQPRNARLLMLAARTHLTAGHTEKGEALLRSAIEVDPSYYDAYRVLGEVYADNQRIDDARREYERLVQTKPDDSPAHTMIAILLQQQGNMEEARKRYEKVLELDPRSAVAANNLAYMQAEKGTDLDRALNLAQTAKAELPDDADIDDTLGWIYVKRNLHGLAIDTLRRSVDRQPDNALYQYHLGVAYLKAGDKERARKALEGAMKADPKFEHAADARTILASIG